MKDTYIKTLLVNLGIVLVAFLLFVFIDTGFINASQAKKGEPAEVAMADDTNDEIEITFTNLEGDNQSEDSNLVTGEEQVVEEGIPVQPSKLPSADSKRYDSLDGPLASSISMSNRNFRDIPPYEWNASHYKDYNTLNTGTAALTVYIDSNKTQTAEVAFYSHQTAYYRFEIAKFVLKGGINPSRAYVKVFRDGKLYKPYLSSSAVRFQKVDGEWVAYWFYGWKTPIGSYRAVLYYNDYPIMKSEFRYIARPLVKFNRAVSFVTLEANTPTYKRSAYNTKGKKVPFTEAMLDWMEYGDIDGFLNLSGETTGWGVAKPSNPWEPYCIKNVEVIGNEVKKKGGLVGAYIMCFYTPQSGWKKGGYSPAKAMSVSSNGVSIYNSSFVSFTDKKRFQDIVALAKRFNTMPQVDMIGFDFIRFGEHAGIENVDQFVREMNVPVPANWNKYSQYQKMHWMGLKVRGISNPYKLRWDLWKAHRTAEFVYQVRKEAQLTKPIWVFTLGWDHGTQHGQDPIMFSDAGVMIDNVMLYEATPSMFSEMIKSWKNYLYSDECNYVPGNQIDGVVNRSGTKRNVVEEYYYRLAAGSDFAPGGSEGVFIHDMIRAFWSPRRKGYSYYEWLLAGFSAVSHNRYRKGEIPFHIQLPEKALYYRKGQETVNVPIRITFTPEQLRLVQGKQLVIENYGQSFVKKFDITLETNVILYKKVNPRQKGANYLAIKGKIDGYPSFFTFQYLNFKLATDGASKDELSMKNKPKENTN